MCSSLLVNESGSICRTVSRALSASSLGGPSCVTSVEREAPASLLGRGDLASLERERPVGATSTTFLVACSVFSDPAFGSTDAVFFPAGAVVVAFKSLILSFAVFTFPPLMGGGSGGSVAGP